jgi:predicted phosphodiesterase
MKIQLLSDLHHEFSLHAYQETDADVLVLAGDIDTGVNGITWAKTLGKPVIYVSGNHEFYRHEMTTMIDAMREEAQGSNVHFLETDAVVIDGVRFLGTTLWTDFKLFGDRLQNKALRIGGAALNDFRVIRYTHKTFTAEDSLELNAASVHWLGEQLNGKHEGPTVVVTHHMPSEQCVSPRFKSDIVSSCFASNLDHLMGKAALWCYGHTHDSGDVTINGTRIVGNPRGYSRRQDTQENELFNPALVLTV